MPTSDLEQVSGLVTRLLTLTQAAPGTLIRAQDWNTVVGGLVELARPSSPPPSTPRCRPTSTSARCASTGSIPR